MAKVATLTFFFKTFLQEVAESVKEDFGSIDILVHSLANGPEVNASLHSLFINIF